MVAWTKILAVAALAAVIGGGSMTAMAATSKTKPAAKTAVKKMSTVTKKKTGKTLKHAAPHKLSAGNKKPTAAKTLHKPA